MSALQLLKMSVIAHLYNSADVTMVYLTEYDRRSGTQLAAGFQALWKP